MPSKRKQPGSTSAEAKSAKSVSIEALTATSLKNTLDMFAGNVYQKIPLDEASQRLKIRSKVRRVKLTSGPHDFVRVSPFGSKKMLCQG